MNIHYVCTGGCKGVLINPGICQSTTCVSHGHKLVECHCQDGMHEGIITPCANCGELCKANGGKGCEPQDTK